jgi:hypothetical protein
MILEQNEQLPQNKKQKKFWLGRGGEEFLKANEIKMYVIM